jgi:hypothetical protein
VLLIGGMAIFWRYFLSVSASQESGLGRPAFLNASVLYTSPVATTPMAVALLSPILAIG